MPRKKRRRKKSGIIKLATALFLLVKYIFKGIYYIFKGLYIAVRWLINKLKKRRKEEKPVKKGKIKSKPKQETFKELKTIKGNFKDYENKILTSKSTVGIILGARGTGKSAIGMKLLEDFKLKTNKKVYAMGFNAADLPDWINVVNSVDELENGSVLLADESGIEFSSRESMSDINKLLSKIILVARHKDLSIMFITQNSANIDINIIRQSDYLILKQSSLLQKDFERKKIKDIYQEVDKEFEELKSDRGLTYIYSNDYRGFISSPLPSFWSDKVSKAYSGFKKG